MYEYIIMKVAQDLKARVWKALKQQEFLIDNSKEVLSTSINTEFVR